MDQRKLVGGMQSHVDPRMRRSSPKKPSMPKKLGLPSGQIWVGWECKCCQKDGLFTIPAKSDGTFPFEIALGIHRTVSRSCKMRDVTLTSQKGVLTVVLERGKSGA